MGGRLPIQFAGTCLSSGKNIVCTMGPEKWQQSVTNWFTEHLLFVYHRLWIRGQKYEQFMVLPEIRDKSWSNRTTCPVSRKNQNLCTYFVHKIKLATAVDWLCLLEFICWNPHPQEEGIKRCSPSLIGAYSWWWSLMNRINALYKGTSESSLALSVM